MSNDQKFTAADMLNKVVGLLGNQSAAPGATWARDTVTEYGGKILLFMDRSFGEGESQRHESCFAAFFPSDLTTGTPSGVAQLIKRRIAGAKTRWRNVPLFAQDAAELDGLIALSLAE